MEEVHRKTREVTNEALSFEVSKRLPWFLRVRAPQSTLRPVLNWILKRYPGMNPPTCRNCLRRRATQEHISSCDSLLPEAPPRFKPKLLLYNPSFKNNQILKDYSSAPSRSLKQSKDHLL